AVRRNDEIGATAAYLLQERQSAAAGALLFGDDAKVFRSITDEGHFRCVEMRDHDFAEFAGRERATLVINDLQQKTIGGDVHDAGRTLVSEDSGITSSLTVDNGTTDRGCNLFPPLFVQIFASNKYRANTGAPQINTSSFRVTAK